MSKSSWPADGGRGWPPHAVETLEQLWKAGDLSASQIARRLGVSRNAVLGKVFRLGLSGQRAPSPLRTSRPPTPQRRRPSHPAERRRIGARSASPTEAPASASPPLEPALEAAASETELPGLVAHLEDLAPDACHWPCGDPKAADFAFCGRRTLSPPYCVAHDRRAYRKGAVASLSQLLKLAARSS
jgi:GcrA cell cycle regulator